MPTTTRLKSTLSSAVSHSVVELWHVACSSLPSPTSSLTDPNCTRCNRLCRVICSPALWAAKGSASCSLILKAVIAANTANASDEDPLDNRVWILPLEFLQKSIEAGELLDQEDYDLELILDQSRRDRAKELREERKANGGKALFANRKARRDHELAQNTKEALEDEEEEERQLKAAMAASGGGVPVASGTLFDGRPVGGIASGSGSDGAKAKVNVASSSAVTSTVAKPNNTADISSFFQRQSKPLIIDSDDDEDEPIMLKANKQSRTVFHSEFPSWRPLD